MHRSRSSGRTHPDLLAAAPSDARAEDRWAARLIDPAAQLAELADLVARGLVTPEEFERQRKKIFDAQERDARWTR